MSREERVSADCPRWRVLFQTPSTRIPQCEQCNYLNPCLASLLTMSRSPQSAGGSSISYQTNVNRQKTRKWAEAKPVDYGGDDWGDDDEYDPPPPPISKPTGLRQQGKSAANSPVVDKKYGELPPLPGASNPRPRANSFDADDEKRDFSSSTHQPQPRAWV